MTRTHIADFVACNFRPLRSGRFNNRGWATFEANGATGICEDAISHGLSRWSDCRVIASPGTERALEIAGSRVTRPHAAAESWSEGPHTLANSAGHVVCNNHMVAHVNGVCAECGFSN